MEKKAIKENHIEESSGRNAPEASQGKIWDVPGTPRIYVEIPMQGAQCPRDRWDMSTGQMGHVHGTDGTQTRGCPAKILSVYWFFFPNLGNENTQRQSMY